MIKVTDHALLRYLERHEGQDVELTRGMLDIWLAPAHAAAAKLGVRTYAVRSQGLQFIVRDARLITVRSEGSPGERFRALGHRD